MTRTYAPRIELMSRPSSSTVVAPAFSRSNIPQFLGLPGPCRRDDVIKHLGPDDHDAVGVCDEPVTGAHRHVPESDGAAYLPRTRLAAPGRECPRAKTGNSMAASLSRSRTVPSMTSATMPAACAAVARTSPQYPRETSPATVTARTLPRGARATRGMHGEVVPDGTADSECRAGEARARPHGVDAGIQALAAAFAERRAAQLQECAGNGGFCFLQGTAFHSQHD